jgi:hypothetical protein
MDLTVQRFVRAGDLTLERAWQLIEWCAERGGNEFSIRLMGLGGQSASAHARFQAALSGFHRGEAKREQVTNLPGSKSRNPTNIWQCCPESIEALRECFPNGVFAPPSYTTEGWFEDFTIYRRGEIMLGVVNHEEVTLLLLTDREHQELSELKIMSHETAI